VRPPFRSVAWQSLSPQVNPPFSPCGMGVDFVRSCFKGYWRFFEEQPEVLCHGQFCFIPDDIPHLPFPHDFGSDHWRQGDEIEAVGTKTIRLGHDKRLGDTWYPGITPDEIPTKPVGSQAEFDAKHFYPFTPPVVLQDGFDSRCFVPACIPPEGALLCSLFDLAINNCAMLSILEQIHVLTGEEEFLRVQEILRRLMGTDTNFHIQLATDQYPAFIIAWNDNETFIDQIGTSTAAQWIEQISTGTGAPTNFGAYSTLPLNYVCATRIFSALAFNGVNPANPVLLFGHSLGGAIQCNVAARWKLGNPQTRIRLITSGTPKPGDQRLQDLLVKVERLHFITPRDPVPRIPPSNAQKTALQLLFPYLPDDWFGTWIPMPYYLYIREGGVWDYGLYTDLEAFEWINIFTGWWVVGLVQGGLEHLAPSYVKRLQQHCPCPELPFDAAFYVLTFGTAECFITPIVLGGAGVVRRPAVGLILGGAGELEVHLVPDFNLEVKIWYGATWGPGINGMNPPPAEDLLVEAALRYPEFTFSTGVLTFWMYLLLPAVTDVDWQRTVGFFTRPDIVECPKDSRRFYEVQWVDDVDKELTSEYRVAVLKTLLSFPFPKVEPIP